MFLLRSTRSHVLPQCPTLTSSRPPTLPTSLRFAGRKRTHNADEIMAEIVAKHLVEHLERSGFVVMRKPPIGGGAALGRGFESR